jgi:aspartyl-tRNA(Asn)/glutamyl-tRNA(Gln) amidotransferase subunit A
MGDSQLPYLTLAEAAELLEAGKLSPVELARATLDRIQELAHLKAYITVMGEQALAAAREAEAEIRAGKYRGPLHGIPVGLKDLVNTAGVLTTGGSPLLAKHVPSEDAHVVKLLRDAGAVFVGKLNMFEFAFGATGINPHYGTAANPWDPTRMPGGSSSGSGVGVAAGLCAMALGSDTGGSIRVPAAFCGIAGIKPTYGRVSRAGVLPLAWSMDHVGPMARGVEDLALSLNVLAGYDPADPGSAPVPVSDFASGLKEGVRGLRIGLARDDFFEHAEDEVARAVEDAADVLRALGADVREVPFRFVRESGLIGAITPVESGTYHLPRLRERWDEYDPELRARFLPGLAVTGRMYLNAQRARAVFNERMRAAFETVDAVIAPTVPFPAPPLEQRIWELDGRTERINVGLVLLNQPCDLSGFPALSLPCGFTSGGLPIGLQVMGKPWDEATVLRVGHAYEQATPWHTRHPLP